MDATEALPKDFIKKSELVPIGNHGISSLDEFRKSEEEVRHVEWLKSIGLSQDEVKLYEEHKSGVLNRQIDAEVLQCRLEAIFKKISDNEMAGSNNNDQPSTSTKNTDKSIETNKKSITFYPEGHPMHSIQDLEKDMFGHLQDDNILSLNKRRKVLRHIERRKERVQEEKILIHHPDEKVPKPGSLWDVKEPCQMPRSSNDIEVRRDQIIGPKKPTMYTVKDNKIVRLEPITQEDKVDEYRAIDIVIPVNEAEQRLLEGTKMSLDDIKKMERFKDYEPGMPSKTLYLKNIATSVSKGQLTLLFNQFVQDNGGPIDVRLMSSGTMRGQAFVAFQNEDASIRALEEVNGTILDGQPIIAQFGRQSNRIHDG